MFMVDAATKQNKGVSALAGQAQVDRTDMYGRVQYWFADLEITLVTKPQ